MIRCGSQVFWPCYDSGGVLWTGSVQAEHAQELRGGAGVQASGNAGPGGLCSPSSVSATFDEDLSNIMTTFDVPKALQDKLLARNVRELCDFAQCVADVSQWTAIMNGLDPAITDRREVAKVRQAFKAAQARIELLPRGHTHPITGFGSGGVAAGPATFGDFGFFAAAPRCVFSGGVSSNGGSTFGSEAPHTPVVVPPSPHPSAGALFFVGVSSGATPWGTSAAGSSNFASPATGGPWASQSASSASGPFAGQAAGFIPTGGSPASELLSLDPQVQGTLGSWSERSALQEERNAVARRLEELDMLILQMHEGVIPDEVPNAKPPTADQSQTVSKARSESTLTSNAGTEQYIDYMDSNCCTRVKNTFISLEPVTRTRLRRCKSVDGATDRLRCGLIVDCTESMMPTDDAPETSDTNSTAVEEEEVSYPSTPPPEDRNSYQRKEQKQYHRKTPMRSDVRPFSPLRSTGQSPAFNTCGTQTVHLVSTDLTLDSDVQLPMTLPLKEFHELKERVALLQSSTTPLVEVPTLQHQVLQQPTPMAPMQQANRKALSAQPGDAFQ